MYLDNKNIYLICYRDMTEIEKRKKLREVRKKFVEEELREAKKKEKYLTSKEIQAYKKVIEENIQIIRHQSVKILKLLKPAEVPKIMKNDEKWIFDIQNSVEMVLSIILYYKDFDIK
jgi:hypothetical protein